MTTRGVAKSRTRQTSMGVGLLAPGMRRIHTGEVPTEANMVHEKLVDGAFDKLGALDQELSAAANKVRKHGVAIAGDTGNRKHCAQYKGAMEVMAACVWEAAVGPVAKPLACKDLGNDQVLHPTTPHPNPSTAERSTTQHRLA